MAPKCTYWLPLGWRIPGSLSSRASWLGEDGAGCGRISCFTCNEKRKAPTPGGKNIRQATLPFSQHSPRSSLGGGGLTSLIRGLGRTGLGDGRSLSCPELLCPPTGRTGHQRRASVQMLEAGPEAHLFHPPSPPLAPRLRRLGWQHSPGSWQRQGLLRCFLEQGAPRPRHGEGVSRNLTVVTDPHQGLSSSFVSNSTDILTL